jgi:RNA polymerase sigma-70 factor (ECF subfamily)
VTGAAAAEQAARTSYGRLLALLAWQWRDVAAAEDALAEAFAQALSRWPADGVPDAPDGWLLTVARRELLQAARRRRVAQDPAVLALFDGDEAAAPPADVPDQRLKLLFVCAHPALAPDVHAPLMLQTVLGLDAARIAQAFLVSPAAMAQRLVRAKSKIRAAGLRFEEPEARELPQRLDAVLEGIYGAYAIGSNTALSDPADGAAPTGLAGESLFLARLVTALQPACAEGWGLLALMLFCEARRGAQFGADGAFVPLSAQDPAQWDGQLLVEAERCLWQAAALRQPGPYQLEAAIQSAHAQRARGHAVPWQAVVALYTTLLAEHPSTGARLGYAAALAEAGDPFAGLASLTALDEPAVRSHQPYWVTKAHLHRRCGQGAQARAALERAIGLTEDPRVRAHLEAQR